VAEAPGPGGEEAAERCHALYGAAGTTTPLAGGPADSQFLGFSRSLVVNGATVPDAAVATVATVEEPRTVGSMIFIREGEIKARQLALAQRLAWRLLLPVLGRPMAASGLSQVAGGSGGGMPSLQERAAPGEHHTGGHPTSPPPM
jgi:hypothetical protein